MIDLANLKHLKVQATSQARVWRISLPKRLWRVNDAMRERRSVLEALHRRLPFRALWLSVWADQDHAGWRLLAIDDSLGSLEDKLANGAWALFFFSHSPQRDFSEVFVPTEPRDAAAALRVLHDLGANAAIWSWYDDGEWLVAVLGEENENV